MTTHRSFFRHRAGPRRTLLADTRGAGLVEYIILVGLIALAALAGFSYFGSSVNTKARHLGDRVNTEIP